MYLSIPNGFKALKNASTGPLPIPLILTTKCSNNIVGFEIQEKIYGLAKESIELNNCTNQIEVINDDVKNIKNYFPGNNFDVITCNPPYFKCQKKSLTNENNIKAIARHEIKIDLESIIRIAAENLNNKGAFYMVHRPERLDEIINFCLKKSLAVKKITLVTTKEDGIPTVLLIKAVKNGNYGVKINILSSLDNYKTYQSIFK